MTRDPVLMEGWSEFYPYSYLLIAADTALEAARRELPGRNYHLVSAVVNSAFAVEAAGNHVGIDHVQDWMKNERRPWRTKLEDLARRFSLTLDWNAPPAQTVLAAFDIRDKLAHGKTWRGTGSYIDEGFGSRDTGFPDWLLPCFNEAWATQTVHDARELIRSLLAAANYPAPELELSKMGSGQYAQAEDQRKEPGMTWMVKGK